MPPPCIVLSTPSAPRSRHLSRACLQNLLVFLGSGVVIEIVDNGPGVDRDDMPRIFDRGYRGRQPRESGIPGTGLGLAIARDVMRSMGGDLTVENKADEGWGAGAKLFLPRRRR